MDILMLASYVTLFFIPIILYLTVFKKRAQTTGVYRPPNWYYLVKYLIAKSAVKKIQHKQQRNTQSVKDEPQQITESWISDTQLIFGIDQNGNVVHIKMALKKHKTAQITIYLRLKDSSLYTLPIESGTLSCSIANYKWKAAGLTIETLEPFRRLRITYNGFARKLRYFSDTVEHLQFHFIWNSAEKPLHFPQDVSSTFLADAIAREKWRDGGWTQLLPEQTSYDQYGILIGFVKGENIPEELYFNLPSWRERSIGVREELALYRYVQIVGAAEDGTVFALGVKSFKDGCTHLKYGSVILNNGDVHPIRQHDITLYHLSENKRVPDVFVVHFAAAPRSFKCVLHMKTSETIKMTCAAKHGWETFTVPAECDLDTQQAKAVVTFWYKLQGQELKLPEPLLTSTQSHNISESLVLNLSNPECRNVAISGGKGNSLALLTSIDQKDAFIVPPGFVVTVRAFEKQSTKTNIGGSIRVLQEEASGKLSEACDRAVEVICKEPILEQIMDGITSEFGAVTELLKDNEMKSWKWAVRSSGIGEDSEELSAAGQNSTILGCTTLEDILKAVAECWGSLYTFQSVEYRRQHGLPITTKMAVVVQKMVPSDCAGVLFTCHPASNNPGEMLVTSNYGLGESVVSGQADPDTIILKRTWDGKISYHSQQVGGKNCSIVANEDSAGTKTVNLSKEMVENVSISKTQARQLGRIGVMLEEAFGGPRDIEWAFYKNRLYLLQSRPITTINTWTDFELLHEFDTPILSEQDTVFTRANCGEVFPGALTALTTSTTARQVDESMSLSVGCYNPYTSKSLPISQHHVFIDVINTVMRQSSPNKDFMSKAVDIAIFGHLVGNAEMHKVATARFGINSAITKFIHSIEHLQLAWNSNRSKTIAFAHAQKDLQLQNCQTATEIHEQIHRGLKMFTDACVQHCSITRVSIFYQFVAMNVLVERSDDFTIEHYQDIALLLSSCEGLVSVQIPTVLSHIADEIGNENLAEQFLKVKPNEARDWLKQTTKNAGRIFEKFLREHGHRSLREFELMEEIWGTNPERLIEILQMNVKYGKQTAKSETLSVDETIAKLVSPKSKITRAILKTVMKKCRAAVADREATKSELVRCVAKLRTAFRQLAQKLVNEGRLPHKNLIFHFTRGEIEKLLQEPQPNLVAKAFRRQRLYKQWDKMVFPEISHGFPVPETTSTTINTTPNTNKTNLQGTPVYPGEITARACVLTELENAKQIQAGDVLITHCTDIGWSPYFPMLGAVVTELGGLMSHGAVVAREYGLPCVIGVQNATKMFVTGDKVHLSGKTGVICLVNE